MVEVSPLKSCPKHCRYIIQKYFCSACPEGFSYFGEVDIQENERNFWVEGEKSPTYSCYSLHLGITNWTAASQQ